MGRTTRLGCSVARFVVTVLLGAALALLGGTDATAALGTAPGALCAVVEEPAGGGTGPSAPSPATPDPDGSAGPCEPADPSDRRRDHRGHRTGRPRPLTAGQSEALLAAASATAAGPVLPARRSEERVAPEGAGGRRTVLRC
ncbi:hypothetical protein ACWEQL_00855 [Kitasatospora sp. NPDC004240]